MGHPCPTKITFIYNTMLTFIPVSFCIAYIFVTVRVRLGFGFGIGKLNHYYVALLLGGAA